MSTQTLNKAQTPSLFIPLVALWALVESGLGGIMHAFHLPFTGIFIGGFAVLCIALIAYSIPNAPKTIIQATLVVLVIKAAVNPATSPTAYVAVLFQGLLGSILFQKKSWIKPLAIPFALVCMLESAFQKIALLYIVFGKTITQAFDAFASKVFGIFMTTPTSGFAMWAIGIYISFYVVFGIILGIWIIHLPKNIQSRASFYKELQPLPVSTSIKTRKDRKWKRIYIIMGLLFIGCIAYFLQGQNAIQNALLLLIRVAAIIIFWIYVVIPGTRILINKWSPKFQNKQSILLVNKEMNHLRSWLKPLHIELKKKYTGFTLLKELILGLMVIAIHGEKK
jgi:hypothetical protein